MQTMPWIVLFHVFAACMYLQLEEFGAVRMAIGGASLWACSVLLGSRRPGAERWVRIVCGTLSTAMLVDVLHDPAKSCNIRLTMLAYGLGCLTVFMREVQSRWGRALVKACLFVASLLCTLTIVNSVMRFFHQADPYRIEPTADSASREELIHQPNDLLKWVFAKNFKGHFCHPDYAGESFETNAAGFRDGPWPERPDPDSLRVLVLGDSIAVGLGVERNENYASILESRLTRKLERKVTVFNAAVSGYGPAEQLLVLQDVIARLDPHVVIAMFYDGNDLEDMRFQFFRARFLGKHSIQLKSEEKAILEPGQQAVDFWTKDQSLFYKFVSRTHVGDFIVQRGEQLLSRYGLLAARGPVNWMLLDSMLENGPQEVAEWERFAKLTFARMHFDCTSRGDDSLRGPDPRVGADLGRDPGKNARSVRDLGSEAIRSPQPREEHPRGSDGGRRALDRLPRNVREGRAPGDLLLPGRSSQSEGPRPGRRIDRRCHRGQAARGSPLTAISG
jgi:hypothetical protein